MNLTRWKQTHGWLSLGKGKEKEQDGEEDEQVRNTRYKKAKGYIV